jgi:alpha-N-acetylglucosamine transferase
MKKAFITYLCNDKFVPGAVALAKSLKHHMTKYEVACMVTEEVSDLGRQILEAAGIELVNIDRIEPARTDGIKDRYKETSWMMFTKLNLWRLTDYAKLVFLDADCLAIRNVDEMMDMPAVSAVKDIGYGGISAGVLILEPNMEMFDDMMNDMNKDIYDNTYSDQSFLDWYLKDRKIWNEVPIVYNVLQKRVAFQDGVAIYHYNGQKPWLMTSDNNCHWQMGDNQIFRLWNSFYNL